MKIVPFILSAALLGTSAYAYTDYDDTTETRLLSSLNIMEGYEDGSFKPDETLTRSEAVKSIISLVGMRDGAELSQEEKDSLEPLPYTDLDKSSWDWGYWHIATSMHIINGFDDGTARPNDTVTYAQFIKMLVNSVGYYYYADVTGGYPMGYINNALKLGITANIPHFSYTDPVTRSDAAAMLSSTLNVPLCLISGYDRNELGESTPIFSIADGTADTKWQTLLEFQDIYKLDVTVEEVNEGTATVKIEDTKNLQGKAYSSKDDKVIDVNLNDLTLTKGETASILVRDISADNVTAFDLLFIN